MGSDGHRCQSGHWRRGVRAAVSSTPPASAPGARGWSRPSGLASMLIALSFAEVSSRFDGTGGPYLVHARRVRPVRRVRGGLDAVVHPRRELGGGHQRARHRARLLLRRPWRPAGRARPSSRSIIVAIAAINIRGIRQSSLVLNVLTVGKLVPLVVFIAVGIFFVDPALLVPDRAPTFAELSSTGLLLIFAFGGYEVDSGAGGRSSRPTTGGAVCPDHDDRHRHGRHDAGAGRRPRHASRPCRVEDAARRRLTAVHGRRGRRPADARRRALDDRQQHGPGAVGLAQSLRARRAGRPAGVVRANPSAVSNAGQRHPRHLGVSLVLAVSGRYSDLALVSAISRLLVYVATCASTLRLRSAVFAGQVKPPTFVVPFGAVIPAAAIVIALAMLAGARREQLVAGAHLARRWGAVVFDRGPPVVRSGVIEQEIRRSGESRMQNDLLISWPPLS